MARVGGRTEHRGPRRIDGGVRAAGAGWAAGVSVDRAAAGRLPRKLPGAAGALAALREGLRGVDAQKLALRRRTGLDQLPAPAPIVPPSQRIRELLAELRGDPELGGVARLAHDLMAAVHVPRALHAAEEL